MLNLLIAYIINILDYIFTAHWARLYGIEIEANPFGRWMLENNVAWVFKIFVVGALLLLIGHLLNKAPQLSWIVNIVLIVYAMILVLHLTIAINLYI